MSSPDLTGQGNGDVFDMGGSTGVRIGYTELICNDFRLLDACNFIRQISKWCDLVIYFLGFPEFSKTIPAQKKSKLQKLSSSKRLLLT
jgi:hypothetical protein